MRNPREQRGDAGPDVVVVEPGMNEIGRIDQQFSQDVDRIGEEEDRQLIEELKRTGPRFELADEIGVEVGARGKARIPARWSRSA